MAMEKRCEFCMALRPVVFCKSDAAHLCLSCDAKVHSANALSYRHPRTLVCESCRQQPALVRCFDHQMFMCQSCDISHHASLDHHKKIVSCYVGCPSAKDLAESWGFDFEGLEKNFAVKDQSASSDVSVFPRESVGSKVENYERQQKSSSYLILQQILDLKGLQLSEGIDDSCLARVKERPGGVPFRHDATWKEHRMLESILEHSEGHHDFPHGGSCVGKTEEPLSSPFSHLENLISNGNPINGDSFWHYRSPLHNNEIWLQNMQDLGVCDEVQCFEDVNIPDVDLTFRNFEELFGGDQETSNNACSFEDDQHPSFGRIELTDDIDKEISPSYSVSLFSASRITGESSGPHYNDDGLFPKHVSCDLVNTKSGGQEDATMRYKEKKMSRHEKQGQYTSTKSKSDFKKRGKSQVLKVQGFEGDCGSVTRF